MGAGQTVFACYALPLIAVQAILIGAALRARHERASAGDRAAGATDLRLLDIGAPITA